MRWWVATLLWLLACLLWLAAGCSSDGPPALEVQMGLDATGGLSAADVGSVEVLVLGGPQASCAHALAPPSPLDDPGLEVLRHALFAVDGSAKHLSGVPAGQPLVFYADAFGSTDGSGSRVGRGCAEGELGAGRQTGVSIALAPVDAP